MGAGDEEDGSESHSLIVTRRLHVRPRREADNAALDALAANPAIAGNLCTTIADDDGNNLAIAETHSGRLIGGARHGQSGLGTGREVAVWIGEPDWGRGFATEAMHALVDHVFADGATPTLWCSNRVTNARARRVIEKCGFQFRGSGMVRLAGRGAFPIERFALDRSTWSSLKAWGSGHKEGYRHAVRAPAA